MTSNSVPFFLLLQKRREFWSGLSKLTTRVAEPDFSTSRERAHEREREEGPLKNELGIDMGGTPPPTKKGGFMAVRERGREAPKIG